MKILHIETGNNFYGGPQQVLYLCNSLQQQGFKNTLICSPQSDLGRLASEKNTQVINLKCRGDFDLIFAYQLFRFIRNNQPDIIHCHSRRGADFITGIIAQYCSIPAVLSRRVDSLESNFIAKWRYNFYDKIIAISKNIYDILSLLESCSGKLLLIRSAMEQQELLTQISNEQFLAKYKLSKNDFVVLSAGQLIERKQHLLIIKMINNLSKFYPQLKLIIMGQGKLSGSLKKMVHKFKLQKVVIFGGFDLNLDTYMHHFDLLVHPASKEGLGVILMKASAAGLPVVAFEAGGIPEVIISGKTGLLAKIGDQLAFEKNIAYFIDNQNLKMDYSNRARRWIKDNFSVAEMVEQHIQLYESIYNERKR